MSELTIWFESDLLCLPLNTMKDIQKFLHEPPAWRTLCKHLQQHSKYLVNNCEVNSNFSELTLENPLSFCHFTADREIINRHQEKNLPKTLVCHDMANGYHDDSAIDGTENFAAYTFYNWAAVDIFCYFSHHLITVPPLGWINVAHAHGVKVIGTVITEWAEGTSFWNKILHSDVDIHNMVSALVTIAKTLKFEGWLLNVENKIAAPDKLLQFVTQLHKMLHEEIPDAVLIWYDSVTEDGNLSWQNKLNDKNRVFFDACDGIFTNYSWSESDVAESAREAGDRIMDVFVGVDVWGRNFYGGGMFNTQQALKLIHEHGCSVAIFAPAWTHEAMCDENESSDLQAMARKEPLEPVKQFLLRDRALWGSLWPFLKTRVPSQLPFKTSFCRGLGKKRRMYGEVLCNTPWYNLRHMEYQPNSMHGAHGYILSSKEKIKRISRMTVRDVGGIMKFRQSLIQLNTLPENECIEDNEIKDEDEDVKVSSRAIQQDSITALEDTPNKESRLKNVFRHLFGFKKTKIAFKEAETETVAASGSDTSHEAQCAGPASSSSLATSTGRSMQLAAVTLQLGRGAAPRLAVAAVPHERECLEVYFDDCFTGGTCLKVNPSDRTEQEDRTIRLFHCDFFVEDTLVVCLVTKNMVGFMSQYASLRLAVAAAGGPRGVALEARRAAHPCALSSAAQLTAFPLPHADREFKELQAYLVVHEPGFYVPVENVYGWKVFYFQVRLPASRVLSLSVRAGDSLGGLLLGHLGLCARTMHAD